MRCRDRASAQFSPPIVWSLDHRPSAYDHHERLWVDLHNALRSSGTSPNRRITLASPNSPVAGSPVRLNAMAPAQPGLRESASARVTAALALRHSTASPGVMPSSLGTNESAT